MSNKKSFKKRKKPIKLTRKQKIKKCSSNQNLKERSLNESQSMIKK